MVRSKRSAESFPEGPHKARDSDFTLAAMKLALKHFKKNGINRLVLKHYVFCLGFDDNKCPILISFCHTIWDLLPKPIIAVVFPQF